MSADEQQTSFGILLCRNEDGRNRVEVCLEDDTVWLSQVAMAELFQTSVANISMRLRSIFAEGELHSGATVKDSLTIRREGKRS